MLSIAHSLYKANCDINHCYENRFYTTLLLYFLNRLPEEEVEEENLHYFLVSSKTSLLSYLDRQTIGEPLKFVLHIMGLA